MATLLQVMRSVPQAAAAPVDASVIDACMDEAAAAAGTNAGRAVSLAIVDGVDVVQVKLFAGIQPPSESY
jgi:D-serine deaminase-like pyridoxal phosphate-dependent protein